MRKSLLATAGLLLSFGAMAKDVNLLNVSYAPTRELYVDINKAIAAQRRDKSGAPVNICQSQSGSGKQARCAIDGLGTGLARSTQKDERLDA